MAITGSLTLQGTLLGLPGGSKSPFVAWTISAGVGTILVTDVATGSGTTITVPSGNPTLAIITPPTGNLNVLTAKGVSGDTGIALRKNLATPLTLDTGVTSFVLTATGGTIAGVEINFV